MAVEIPVIVDIDGAFQEAASRVRSAMQPLQKAVDKNVVNIRVDNSSIKENNEELEKLNAWYRRLESAEWSRIGEKLDLGPTINRAILELQRLEKEINEIQELRWSEGGSGDFSFAEEYNNLRQQIQKAKQEVIALEQTQKKMSNAVGINTAEHIENLSKTNFELLQMRDYYQRLEASSEKWASAVNPEVIRHVEGLTRVNFELLQMQEYYKRIEEESMRLSDSVNGYQSRIAELNERWNSMTKAERESAKGQEIRKKYEEEIKALETEAQTLGQIHQKEVERVQEEKRAAEERIRLAKKEAEERRKIAEKEAEERRKAAEKAAEEERKEQERLDKLRQKGIQSRRYENAILNSNVKSMRVLQEQERILSDRLSRTQIGSSKYKQIQRDLASVRLEIEKATGSVSKMNSAFGSQSIALRNLTTMASTYLSVFGALRLVKQIRDVTGELEYQRISLGHLLQDVERGNYLFERIKEAAIESPFRIKDLVTYTKQLAAYRIEQESLFDTTKRLADISAGLGVDMDRLILAFGQVRAASVLRGQELRQFTEAGIPLVELLADKFTELNGVSTSTADVFKLISERAVPFSMIADIFEDLTEKGGMFYKMQEKQAETLKGRWEKLKDAYDIALQSIGDTSTFQRENDIVIGTLRFLAENMRLVVKIADAATISWAAYNAVMLVTGRQVNAVVSAEKAAAIAEAVRSKNISGIIVKLMGQAAAEKALTVAMTQATAGTNALSRALGRLKVALLTNPWLVAGAAILSVVLALSRFKEASKDATDAVNALNQSVDDVHAANKHHERVEKLINQYEKLSKETERTSVQNDILAKTTKKLSDEFPEFSKKLEDQNLSLEQRLALVKELNAEEEKRIRAIKDQKEQELTSYTTRLEDAMADRDEKKAAKESATIYFNTLKAELKDREAAGGKGRGWFSRFLLGENEYTQFEHLVDKVDGELSQAEKAYTEAEGVVSSLESSIKALRKELYGADTSIDEKTKAWKDRLKELQVSSGGVQLFTPEQLEGWHRLYDVSKDLEKEWEKLAVDEKALAAGAEDAKKKGGTYLAQWLQDLSAVRDKKAGLELIRDTFEFIWGKKAKGSDNRLSNLKKDISELTNAYKKFLELRKYMSDSQALSEIGTLFPQLKGWEPSFENTIEKLQDMRKRVAAQLAKSPKDKTLLEMQRALDTEISNLKFDDLKKKFDDELKRIKDEIKRSETARSFYQDILGLTGDEELAASMSISVYGSVGQDFKDRIKKELVDSLSALDAETFAGLDDKIRDAFDTGDYKYLAKNIEKVPEALRATVQQVAADAEKFSADQVRTWIKELAQFKTYGEKRVQLAKQTAQEIEKINASGRPKDVKDSLILEYQRKEAEEAAKLQYEAFKDTPMYIHLFENLDAASTKMLTSMRDNLIRMKENWKDLDPTQLREMQKRIEEIDSQLAAKNPFKAIADGIRAYREQTKGTSREEIERNAILDQDVANAQKDYLAVLTKQYEALEKSATATDEEKDAAKQAMEAQAVVADMAQETANASAQTAENLEGTLKNIADGAENIEKWTSAFSGLGSSVKNLMSEVLSDEDAEAFAEQFDGVMGVIDGLSKSGGGIAKLLKLDFTGIVDIVSGVVDSIAAIFGASNAARIRKANKAIEQQQKIIDNLERSYQRLEEAMDEAFGTDYMYNYRKELEILNAEVSAYRAQAAAERSKGKKADEEKALEYERSAEDAMGRIKEAAKETQSFFAGSDLASAAQDFSSAWLDAYREFGNTAGAIEERMEEMVENLVEKAALSGIVQNVMGGWYESLKGITDWNADAIARKVEEARKLIPIINDGLNTAAAEFQTAGLSLRGTVGQFTGISRDYAAASEESINGLAAGVNTQNFFLQHLDMNVAAILSVLTGGASTAGASVTGEAVDPYKDQMLMYTSHLPTIDANLAELLTEVKRVIKPSGNKYAVQVQM